MTEMYSFKKLLGEKISDSQHGMKLYTLFSYRYIHSHVTIYFTFITLNNPQYPYVYVYIRTEKGENLIKFTLCLAGCLKKNLYVFALVLAGGNRESSLKCVFPFKCLSTIKSLYKL